eukprot:TRINITY_DN1309_c0_g1_i1.p1 TRINITY_DN1309_c0_g1~~TRINITY_DN1309_c0_g1_i1.p1  ORF type:complete len:613 (-),score=261.90 TRINITY_DN1309_c0_g1_i1:103-1824(-)
MSRPRSLSNPTWIPEDDGRWKSHFFEASKNLLVVYLEEAGDALTQAKSLFTATMMQHEFSFTEESKDKTSISATSEAFPFQRFSFRTTSHPTKGTMALIEHIELAIPLPDIPNVDQSSFIRPFSVFRTLRINLLRARVTREPDDNSALCLDAICLPLHSFHSGELPSKHRISFYTDISEDQITAQSQFNISVECQKRLSLYVMKDFIPTWLNFDCKAKFRKEVSSNWLEVSIDRFSSTKLQPGRWFFTLISRAFEDSTFTIRSSMVLFDLSSSPTSPRSPGESSQYPESEVPQVIGSSQDASSPSFFKRIFQSLRSASQPVVSRSSSLSSSLSSLSTSSSSSSPAPAPASSSSAFPKRTHHSSAPDNVDPSSSFLSFLSESSPAPLHPTTTSSSSSSFSSSLNPPTSSFSDIRTQPISINSGKTETDFFQPSDLSLSFSPSSQSPFLSFLLQNKTPSSSFSNSSISSSSSSFTNMIQQKTPSSVSEAPVPAPKQDEEPPAEFLCPISKRVMREPVVAADGFSYELKEIETWLDNHTRSPLTSQPLPHKFLILNHNLKQLILSWIEKNPSSPFL